LYLFSIVSHGETLGIVKNEFDDGHLSLILHSFSLFRNSVLRNYNQCIDIDLSIHLFRFEIIRVQSCVSKIAISYLYKLGRSIYRGDCNRVIRMRKKGERDGEIDASASRTM